MVCAGREWEGPWEQTTQAQRILSTDVLELLAHGKKHLVSFITVFKFSADNVPYLPSWGYTRANEHFPHPLIINWVLGTVHGKDSKGSIKSLVTMCSYIN